MSSERWLGWHFLPADRKLFYELRTLVRVGSVMRLHKSIDPWACNAGFHASKKAVDAVQFGRGPVICRVELRGKMDERKDKAAAQERKCLWMANATGVLREYAIWLLKLVGKRLEREVPKEVVELLEKTEEWQHLPPTAFDGCAWIGYRMIETPERAVDTLLHGDLVARIYNRVLHRKLNDWLEKRLWLLAPEGYSEM